MLLSSLLLLLLSAVFHATANTLMKTAHDKIAFSWWMLGGTLVLGAPVLFFMQLKPDDSHAWYFILASGTLEAIYFFTLTRAYTAGHLSVVYPIARGSAPLFLLIWAIVFLHERPTAFGFAGIFSVVIGLYLINLQTIADWKTPFRVFRSRAPQWALATGFLISTYTAVDKIGVKHFPPFVYLYLLLLVCWLLLSSQWLIPKRRIALIEEFCDRKRTITRILAAAVFGTGGYLLVLGAMRLSPVSYVGPVREVSVVFGSIIGVRYLREPGGSLRVFASVLIALGITLIAVLG